MIEFKVKIGEKEEEFAVRKPTPMEVQESNKVYRLTFSKALNDGELLRMKLDEHLRKVGVWSDEKQAEHDRLGREIADAEVKLSKGGISLTEARELALNVRSLRNDLFSLLLSRNQYDGLTCEALADNARFNYLVSVCTVYKDSKKPYYKDMNAFLADEGPVGLQAPLLLAKMQNDFDSEDFGADFPENKFLKKYGFVDDKLRLINKDGHLIDVDGRLINEEGYYVDGSGGKVDKYGNPLSDNGDLKVEFQPFLDDSGNPIVVEEKVD